MAQQISVDTTARADREKQGSLHLVGEDLAYQRLVMVNVVFYGRLGARDREWVLIDAGLAGTASLIMKAAAERFGPSSRPSAIVLTHGHFDHVGALQELAEKWDAPVYCHELETPYLNGTAAYPPPDPDVGGGMMAKLATYYPRGPIDISLRLNLLPADGSVPGMPGWQWVPTPGHTPGHVSLWRDVDRTLVAGDAFITTAQESAYAVLTQQPELHGPPTYYTQDFGKARGSVEMLAGLEPETVITGHGPAMTGPQMRESLHALADRFMEVAVPEHGRYVGNPATPETGTAYSPPEYKSKPK